MEVDQQEGVAGYTTTALKAPGKSSTVRLPIAGVFVEFPFEPYSVQKYMMSQVISSITKTQNCLLESPTGTGKTLGLLCSSLAWQEKEQKMLVVLHEELLKEKEEQNKLQQAREIKRNLIKAPASSTTPRNEKKEESRVVEGCSGEEFNCECSSDEDIFQPPKRKKQSLGSSSSMHNESKPMETEITTFADELRETKDIKSPVDEKKGWVEPSKHSMENEVELGEEEIKKFTPPTIYYGTRTHKQIAQVVDQLKKTSYAKYVRMTILASRDRTCVNPSVINKPNITDNCKHLIDPASGGGCTYYQGATRMKTHGCVQENGLPQVFDIEDMVAMGNRRKVCPYFTLRNLTKTANIVFCPYNYLIHPDMRESMKINLHRSIVIMDEAHNIEDICRDASSLWLKADEVAEAIKECREHQHKHINVEEYKAIEDYLVKLEDYLTTEGPKQTYSNNNESKVAWPGQNLIDRLHVAGVTKDSLANMLDAIAKIEKAKTDDPESNAAMSGSVKLVCSNIKCCFKYLYQQSNETKFQGFFHREIGFKSDPTAVTWYSKHKRRTFAGGESSGEREWKYALRVLCMDPALVFSEMLVARSIILASGTLSPLDSFKTELGVNFSYVVKGKHVVPPTNLYVSTISNGPSGVSLRGVFENTNTYEYQDELGKVIIETSKIVPHGVLCFFPSYSLMDKLHDRWMSNGLLEELSNLKEVFWEPRRKEEMGHVMTNFTLAIDESRNHQSSVGAIMFGVFRGKIAEGIDFSDENARVVLTVGIPFLNRNSLDINLKIRYNDNRCLTNKSVLNGNKWYSIQAYRALNQALGRCIRHKNDWGAIILVDARFAQREVQENLPIWIKSEARTFQSWSKYTNEIQKFCNSMKENTSPICQELE